MAVAMRGRVAQLAEEWSRRGFDLQLGIGIAQGHATLGRIGFEGRSDYAAIGSVTNLAARLCEQAAPGQILISQRVYAATEQLVDGAAGRGAVAARVLRADARLRRRGARRGADAAHERRASSPSRG